MGGWHLFLAIYNLGEVVCFSWSNKSKTDTFKAYNQTWNQAHKLHQTATCKPLVMPDAGPKRSRRLPPIPNEESPPVSENLTDHNRADVPAQRRNLQLSNTEGTPPAPPDSSQQRGRRSDSLFDPFIPELHCDLSSEDGFIQCAKKKKSKATPINLGGPAKKDEGGAGDGGDKPGGNDDNQNGDAGQTGGDGAGNGDGDDKKDGAGDANPDDNWGTFATVGGKKKKGKQGEDSVDASGSASKFDAFDDIKLDASPSLNINFGSSTADTKTNSVSTWGNSWATGTSFDWSETKAADKTEDKEEKKDDLDVNPWGINRPKPKKKTKATFGFADPDETEELKNGEMLATENKTEKKDELLDFATVGKNDKKNAWGAAEEEVKNTTEDTANDSWINWGASTAKKKGKKGTAILNSEPELSAADPKPAATDLWSTVDTKETSKGEESWGSIAWGLGKKDNQKKKDAIEELKPSEPEPGAGANDDDAGWGWGLSGKKKKGKDTEPDPGKENEDFFSSLTTKKDKKAEEQSKEPDPLLETKAETVTTEPSSAWGFWGVSKKSSKKNNQLPEPAAATESKEDHWLNWSKKDNKKGKTLTALVDSNNELEPEPESEYNAALAVVPGASGDGDTFWNAYGTAKTNRKKKMNADDNLVPDAIDEAQNDNDDWAGFGSSKKNKRSPPPAPTPPSLDMEEAGNEANIWDDAQTQGQGEDDPAAAELAAEIAREEADLAELTARNEKKKLKGKTLARFEGLQEKAKRRAEEAAAKAAADEALLELEDNAAAEEALKAEEKAVDEELKAEQEFAARELEAEIQAEEKELEELEAKSKKKRSRKDNERIAELKLRAEDRAAAATAAAEAVEADSVANNEGVPDAIDSDQANREAEEQQTREAEAAEEEKQRLAGEQAAKDAEELADLQAKTKKNSKVRDRIKELTAIIDARAEAAAAAAEEEEAKRTADSADAQAAVEADEQAAREAEELLAQEAEKILEAEKQAAEDAEEAQVAADIMELEKLKSKKKKGLKTMERIEELTEKINAYAAARGVRAATESADAQAAIEAEEQAAREGEELLAQEAEMILEAEKQAAEDAEEAQAAADIEELEKLKSKKKQGPKTMKQIEELTKKIHARAAARGACASTESADAQATIAAEEQAAHEAAEQAAHEAKELAAREAEEAARKAEEQARWDEEDKELAGLMSKKKLKLKEQKRLDELTKLISDRPTSIDNGDEQAAREAEEQAAREIEEKAARQAEEQAAREAEEQATREAEEQAAQEDEERTLREADEQAARDAEERFRKEEEAELAILTSKSKLKKLGKKDQKRFDALTEIVNARAPTGVTDDGDRQVAREADEQAACEAEEIAAREAEERHAREAAEDDELAGLIAKQLKKKLSKRDQKRFDELNEIIKARTGVADATETDETAQAAEEASREAEEAAAWEAEERAAQNARDAEEQARRGAEEAAKVAREAEEQAERERQEAEAEAAASSKKKSKKGAKADEKKFKSASKDKDKKEEEELDFDNVDLTAEQADEILAGLAPPAKPKAKTDDPFSFWGAKPAAKSSLPEAVSSSQPQHSATTEITFAESTKVLEDATINWAEPAPSRAFNDDWMPKKKVKGSKLAEKLKKFEPAVQNDLEGDLIEVLPEAPAPPPPPEQSESWPSQQDQDILPGSFPMDDDDHDVEFHDCESKGQPPDDDDDYDQALDEVQAVDEAQARGIDETEAEDENEIVQIIDMAPQSAGKKPKKSKKSKQKDLDEDNNEDENAIVEIVDFSPSIEKKSKKSKKAKYREEALPPIPPAVPPPPPAVPDAPPTPPPEVKSSRKERAKINRDGSASWGMWSASASPPKEEKKSSKSKAETKKPKKEKEEKVSSKGSSSDKAERQDRKSAPTPKSRMNSILQSTPPLSRSMSTRDKRASKSGSRRPSLDMSGGLVSPPPEIPEMASKAARLLGVDRGPARRSSRAHAAAEEDDIVMVGARDLEPSPDKLPRKRSKVRTPRQHSDYIFADLKQAKPDDDIVMVDAGGPAEPTPLRRSNSSAKKGISGLFGGFMSSTPRPEPRPQPRRRTTYHTTDDEGRPDKRTKHTRDLNHAEPEYDAGREARHAARRAKREQEKAEEARRAKDEARRERRRRLEEEEEDLRRQEEREARRAERRAGREREAQRIAQEEAEAKERRRLRRLAKEAAAAEAEAEAERAERAERRRSRYADMSEDDEERRRRREARRGEKSSRHRSIPVDDIVYPRERSSKHSIDERGKRTQTAAWPHSGTSSWVKEHSDAGPPPEDGPVTDAPPATDDEEARRAARRAARRRGKEGYGETDRDYEDDQRRRRARREERERRERRMGESDGSGEKGPRESFFTDTTPRSSWWRKLTGS